MIDKVMDCNFELVEEYPGFISGKYPLRLYRSRFSPNDKDKPVEKYRYHFGFPREIVEPFSLLIETTPFWGEKHWKEEDGFWIWWLTIIGEVDKEPPYDKLNKDFDRKVAAFNQVLNMYKKAARGQPKN